MSKETRPYQNSALSSAIAALEAVRAVLLVLATGLGKSYLIALLAKHFSRFGRILILEPTRQLVKQVADEVRESTGLTVGIEMAEQSCAKGDRPQVVVASVGTLSRLKRLQAFEADAFVLVVVDECHHIVAKTYRRIIAYFLAAKLVGLTATADRRDGQSLGQIFDRAPFRFDIKEGIQDGWLVPIHQMVVRVSSIDYSRVRATRGDLSPGDLNKVLLKDEPLQAIAGPTVTHAGDRPTMVFAATRPHAHDLAEVINRIKPKSALAIDGTATEAERKSALEAFKSGQVQFLVNCDLYLEGFNEPSIACVAVARPTRSRARYVQMIGRGTRPSPETGKSNLLVLDFKGNAGRHQLVSALDALAGDLDPRVREAAQLAADHGADVFDAVAQARAQVAAEDARAQAIAEEQRRGVVADVRSHLVEVNPFEPPKNPPPTAPPVQPPPVQPPPAPVSPQVARAIARSRGQLCTPKQARVLERHGIDPTSYSLRSASQLIAAIKKNGWTAPSRPPGRGPHAPSGGH